MICTSVVVSFKIRSPLTTLDWLDPRAGLNLVANRKLPALGERERITLSVTWLFYFPTGAGIFLLVTASRPALRPTLPPIQWVLGVKPPGRESDHSLPHSAKVKNRGGRPPLTHASSWRGTRSRTRILPFTFKLLFNVSVVRCFCSSVLR
jgi:hypothetical protein